MTPSLGALKPLLTRTKSEGWHRFRFYRGVTEGADCVMANTMKTNNMDATDSAEHKESVGSVVRQGEGSRIELLINLQTSLDPEQVLERFLVHVSVHFGIQGLRAELGELSSTPRILGSNARYHLALRMRVEGAGQVIVTLMRNRAFSDWEQAALEEYAGLLHFPLRNAVLYQLALTKARQDDLTGLYNRVALRDIVNRELALTQRHDQPLSLIMLDVDDFKGVNDLHGHQTGDRVLRELAAVLQDCARCGDLLFRYAGDEFLMVSSHTDADGAKALAERIRDRVKGLGLTSAAGPVDLRVSVGVAEASGEDSYERFFERVDQALYRAKHQGRDQVVVAAD